VSPRYLARRGAAGGCAAGGGYRVCTLGRGAVERRLASQGGGFHAAGSSQAEWLLLSPALLAVGKGLVVLLNPPYQPFAQALIQQGMNLERLLVVETLNKADFLASFIELTRSHACDAVLAWQPKQALNYTELRKCLLAASDGSGVYWVFRPGAAQQHSSPAALRIAIMLQERALQVTVFKQKGALKSLSPPILLPLPESWKGLLPHHQLDQIGKPQPKVASVTPLRGGGRVPK
jgi:protein ImuA